MKQIASDQDTVILPEGVETTHGGPRLEVESFGMTHPGRVRPSNEDHFLIASLSKALQVLQSSLHQPSEQHSDGHGHLFLVADGMGGHRAGEQASALAIGTIEGCVLNALQGFCDLQSPETRTVLADLQQALRQADERIFEVTARHPEFRGMGTTVTMAYAVGAELYVAHVGDSRCYLLRAGKLHQLTHDHTLVDEMVRRGLLEPGQAGQHQYRHVITNAVGGHEQGIKVESRRLKLEADDVLLLSSDGLTEMVPPEEIGGLLRTEPEPRRACERLVALANERGGKDNVTVVVARFHEPRAASGGPPSA